MLRTRELNHTAQLLVPNSKNALALKLESEIERPTNYLLPDGTDYSNAMALYFALTVDTRILSDVAEDSNVVSDVLKKSVYALIDKVNSLEKKLGSSGPSPSPSTGGSVTVSIEQFNDLVKRQGEASSIISNLLVLLKECSDETKRTTVATKAKEAIGRLEGSLDVIKILTEDVKRQDITKIIQVAEESTGRFAMVTNIFSSRKMIDKTVSALSPEDKLKLNETLLAFGYMTRGVEIQLSRLKKLSEDTTVNLPQVEKELADITQKLNEGLVAAKSLETGLSQITNIIQQLKEESKIIDEARIAAENIKATTVVTEDIINEQPMAVQVELISPEPVLSVSLAAVEEVEEAEKVEEADKLAALGVVVEEVIDSVPDVSGGGGIIPEETGGEPSGVIEEEEEEVEEEEKTEEEEEEKSEGEEEEEEEEIEVPEPVPIIPEEVPEEVPTSKPKGVAVDKTPELKKALESAMHKTVIAFSNIITPKNLDKALKSPATDPDTGQSPKRDSYWYWFPEETSKPERVPPDRIDEDVRRAMIQSVNTANTLLKEKGTKNTFFLDIVDAMKKLKTALNMTEASNNHIVLDGNLQEKWTIRNLAEAASNRVNDIVNIYNTFFFHGGSKGRLSNTSYMAAAEQMRIAIAAVVYFLWLFTGILRYRSKTWTDIALTKEDLDRGVEMNTVINKMRQSLASSGYTDASKGRDIAIVKSRILLDEETKKRLSSIIATMHKITTQSSIKA